MYYKTDENGNYLGVKSETNKNWEFFSTTPLPTDIARVRNDNGVWVNAETVEEILSNREVPQLVPLWCLRQELQEQNLFDLAVQKINDLEEPFKSRALNFLEYGNFVYRNSPTIEMLGTLLQMNKIEIDTLFINADKINL